MAILYKTMFHDVYDFDFRNYFECKSVISGVDNPVLLHIGVIEDYLGVTALLDEMGMKLRCSCFDLCCDKACGSRAAEMSVGYKEEFKEF